MSVAAKKLAEKHKEELRKLVSQEANRNCFDCGVRGPLYVVLDFHIFVCSSCSAIHRSFQHRVKGITMSDFSSEEVSAISAGGNGKAAACWHGRGFLAVPHSSDERAIKESIRVVFQEKRYHDSSAWQAWQQEVVAASLPPVTVLTSIAEIGPLQPPTPLSRRDAPTATAQQQQQPHVTTTTSAGKASVFSASGPPQQQQQPPLAPATTTAAAVAQTASNKSSTNDPFSFFDSQPIAAAGPPPQQQQQQSQPQQGASAATTTTVSAGVDDFFSSRPSAAPVGPTTTATAPQQRVKVDDLFAAVPTTTNTTTMTAAPPHAASTRHDDFFSVPSASSSAPHYQQPQQQQHLSPAPNFNSNAHFGSSTGATTSYPVATSSSAGATMDFFAPTNAWQATTAPATTSSYSSQPLPQQNKNDFFYDHSQPIHPSASSSSVQRPPVPSSNDPFGAFAAPPPQPSAVPVAGSTATTTTASHDVNFFADLNPFGKK